MTITACRPTGCTVVRTRAVYLSRVYALLQSALYGAWRGKTTWMGPVQTGPFSVCGNEVVGRAQHSANGDVACRERRCSPQREYVAFARK